MLRCLTTKAKKVANVKYLEGLEGQKLKVFVNYVGKYSYFPAMSLGTQTFFLV